MIITEYKELAMRTANHDLEAISHRKDSETIITVDHSILGMIGELGELADTVKKYEIYGQNLDRENLKEELGDLIWYWVLATKALDFDIDEILSENIEKLMKRYPEGFNTKAAIERKDKMEV